LTKLLPKFEGLVFLEHCVESFLWWAPDRKTKRVFSAIECLVRWRSSKVDDFLASIESAYATSH